MMLPKLTEPCGGATGFPGERIMRGRPNMRRVTGQVGFNMAGAIALVGTLGGCINVAAPDKPIVIELNINIRQEVVFALAKDAANTVEENADIF
ncbi:MAG: YnbE family lipoprotein [Pseudomonadota bacterium]